MRAYAAGGVARVRTPCGATRGRHGTTKECVAEAVACVWRAWSGGDTGTPSD